MSTMVEVVCKYEHQGSIISSSSSSSNKVKWLKHYSSDHRILLVGDGDFSFSLSLAMAFGGASNIVATSLDSYDDVIKKYKGAEKNLEILLSLGAELWHEVDALQMKLHKNLQMQIKYGPKWSPSGSKTTGATPKKRTPSERIVKKKLSMHVDGPGSSSHNATTL